MDFKDKSDKRIQCKMSYIPVQLCELPAKGLMLTVVYIIKDTGVLIS